MTCICDYSGVEHEPDWAVFRVRFPAFANETKYPDGLLNMIWEEIGCFIDKRDYGQIIGECRLTLLYYFEAHMLALLGMQNKGQQGGFITNSTIDKVSVGKTAPPSSDMLTWWLGNTPYGQMLLAMIEANTVGGDYYSGVPELAAFRRVGGIFYPGM